MVTIYKNEKIENHLDIKIVKKKKKKNIVLLVFSIVIKNYSSLNHILCTYV